MRHPSFVPAFFSAIVIATATGGCSNGSTTHGQPQSKNDGGSSDAGVTEVCDKTHRPILFVHGYLGGGDNFELPAQRFSSNGYCRSAIRGFDYDAYTFAAADAATQATTIGALDAAVDAFISDSGFAQIDLVGHSLGTLVSSQYLSTATQAAKIAHYAQAAGGGIAEPVPQANLSSDGDFLAGHPKKIAPAPATNPDIGYLDHIGVLTSAASFAAMYGLFNDGAAPKTEDVVAEAAVQVSGFYKNFSDNTPHPGVEIDVYEVDPATGDRVHAKPDFALTTATDGGFGPFVAKPSTPYEFYAPEAGEDGRPQHTYRAGFTRSTHLMYLKAFPKTGTAAAGLLAGKFPYEDTQSGLIIQHGNHAMISAADPGGHGKDSLTVGGSELLTPTIAAESRTLVALFAFDSYKFPDGGLDDQAPLSEIKSLSSLPFLNGIDVSLPVSDTGPITVVFDTVKVNVHRWKSNTDGNSLVFFDN